MTYGGDFQQAAGVRENDILADKYRVERVLGAGGMGVVVSAHHVDLGTKVAIKFLLPSMLENQESVARFAREARAAAKIASEHVARVFDVGTLPSGAPYMVMEYLEGGDLAAWLKQRGPLPIEQAIEFVLQACVAVADAHALGIVHRDLKPANLFCVRRSDGQLAIKVLDFGISKVSENAAAGPGAAMTQASVIMGSPLYMSPEQMQSAKDVDAGTDIWALGVILFELVTGNVPFRGETLTQIAIAAATQPPARIRDFRPDVDSGLEAVVLRCLEKDRRARYRNVAELARALADFAPKRARAAIERISGIIQGAGLSESALEIPPSPVPVSAGASGTVAAMGRTTRPFAARRVARRAWVVGIVAVGILVGGAWVMRSTRTVASGASGQANLITQPQLSPPAPSSVTSPVAVGLAPLGSASGAAAAEPVSAAGGAAAGGEGKPRGEPRSRAAPGDLRPAPTHPAAVAPAWTSAPTSANDAPVRPSAGPAPWATPALSATSAPSVAPAAAPPVATSVPKPLPPKKSPLDLPPI